MKDEEMAEEYAEEKVSNLDECRTKDLMRSALKNGFLAGLKAGRPQWHDLRKAPTDLPKESVIEGLSERVIGAVEIARNQYMSQECRYDFVRKVWKTHKDPYVTDVIAWCELPTFDKE